MIKEKSILITTLLAVSVILLLAGCGAAEPETAHTVESGAYQIEILAPGGEFRAGEISLIIRAMRDGEIIELDEGRLDLHMPAMGAMPRMDTGTGFTKSGVQLTGDIFFEMDGAWQGTLELTTADGEAISESIRVRVR
ncbi:MAG: hypothetical protein ACFCU6_01185 [Balneolaceae bacterium]